MPYDPNCSCPFCVEIAKAMDKPKAKMTRAEAIKSFADCMAWNEPTAFVDFYIEAGMLEVVEEKPKTIMMCNVDGQVSTFDLEYVKQIIKNST